MLLLVVVVVAIRGWIRRLLGFTGRQETLLLLVERRLSSQVILDEAIAF